MTFEAFLSLALFALVATASPGGATALATASGAQFGFRRSAPMMIGIALGLASLAAAAALGLAGLLLGLPSLRLALQVAGSAYLLWLAWTIAGQGAPRLRSERASPLSFWNGALLLWLNPKGWAVALAAGASFAGLARDPLQLALLLGATFGLAATLALSLWCAAGLLLARLLRGQRQWRLFNGLLGLLLAASVLPLWLD